METAPQSPAHPNRPEWGLLLALLLFFCGAAWVLVTVIRGANEPQAAGQPAQVAEAADEPLSRPAAAEEPPAPKGATRDSEPLSAYPKSKKPLSTWRPTVTIVHDAKAHAALADLRVSPAAGTAAAAAKPKTAAETSEPQPAPEPPAKKAPAAELEGELAEHSSPDVKDALSLLGRFRSAKGWRDKQQMVHQPLKAEIPMQEFYGSQGGRDPEPGLLLNALNLTLRGRKVLSLMFANAKVSEVPVQAVFHRTSEGLKLDWESFVGYSPKTWAEFRSARGSEPLVFRAWAMADDYFNFEFSDNARFVSVRLHSPDGEEYLHGYCARDSEDGRKLIELIGEGPNDHTRRLGSIMLGSGDNARVPVTVSIAFPPQARSDRCVRIEKFISPMWLGSAGEDAAVAAAAAEDSPGPKAN